LLPASNAYGGSFASLGNDEHNYLGRSNWREAPWTDQDLQGQMTEVRVWKIARTEAEIRGTMFQKLTGAELGLLGLWNFADGSANDASPGAHHGKLVGQARVVDAALPSANSFIPWSRLLLKVTDASGTRLPNVNIRAEVKGVEVGIATPFGPGLYALTVWTTASNVDVVATGTNDFGGWLLSVPITPYTERAHDWPLGRASQIAGHAVALDGKTPHGQLVVELVRLEGTEKVRSEISSIRPCSCSRSVWT
jgi:hypothetical protein